MNVTHLGALNTVTGSCHLLQSKGINILVDCGMAQGRDTVSPMSSWLVSPKEIHFLFLTHAHVDHIGRIPELVQNGFAGEILCTHPTRALLEPLLSDALNFTDLGRRQKQSLLERIDERAYGFEFNQDFSLKKGIRFSSLDNECEEKRICPLIFTNRHEWKKNMCWLSQNFFIRVH
jgi:metallo-beta-lactamase family protein